MNVNVDKLRRRLGLRAGATEAQIRAALAAPAPRAPAVRPMRPRLTEGVVAAMTSSQLQAAQREPLADDERRLVNEETDHRTHMALSLPGVARASGYAPVRRDLSQRSPSVLKGISE